MELIDKDALVAEIEKKLKNVNLNYISAGSHPSATDTNKKLQDGISKNLQSLLSYIDTLEVKEVDLEKDIQNVIYNHFFDLNGIAITGTSLYATVDDMVYIAKHFFELGLKAQKGE